MENLDQETDPQTFWKTIKKLQGNTTKTKATYLKDHQNKKIYDNKQKEFFFPQYWEKGFSISKEENE